MFIFPQFSQIQSILFSLSKIVIRRKFRKNIETDSWRQTFLLFRGEINKLNIGNAFLTSLLIEIVVEKDYFKSTNINLLKLKKKKKRKQQKKGNFIEKNPPIKQGKVKSSLSIYMAR